MTATIPELGEHTGRSGTFTPAHPDSNGTTGPQVRILFSLCHRDTEELLLRIFSEDASVVGTTLVLTADDRRALADVLRDPVGAARAPAGAK